jgi:hypothetical protein
MQPRSAQEEQDEILRNPLKKLASKAELRAVMEENAKNGLGSSSVGSSKKTDIVAKVMEKHGFTEEQALEEIRLWGG